MKSKLAISSFILGLIGLLIIVLGFI